MPKRIEYVNAVRDAVSKKQIREIESLYRGAARALYREERRLKELGDTSGAAEAERLRNLAEEQVRRIREGTYSLVTTGVSAVSGAAGSVLSPSVANNLSTVVVSLIVTGSVYGGSRNWNLSDAVWKTTNRHQQDIYAAIARSIALGESPDRTADRIAKYLNPDYLFMDDAGHAYVHKSDYAAQRLVRTLTTHAYQQAVISTTRSDPSCIGYRWHAQGANACQLCQERDGMVFDKNSVPFDHPNGRCTIEPVYDTRIGTGFVSANDELDDDLERFVEDYLAGVTTGLR